MTCVNVNASINTMQLPFKNDDISQNSIITMIQSPNGYIWFGTHSGLNRFDGYKFKIYRSQLNNTNSLVGNVVLSLAQDSKGIIWIAT